MVDKTVRLNEDGSLRTGTLQEIADSDELKSTYVTVNGDGDLTIGGVVVPVGADAAQVDALVAAAIAADDTVVAAAGLAVDEYVEENGIRDPRVIDRPSVPGWSVSVDGELWHQITDGVGDIVAPVKKLAGIETITITSEQGWIDVRAIRDAITGEVRVLSGVKNDGTHWPSLVQLEKEAGRSDRTKPIIRWGDSLTANSGASAAALSALLGRPIVTQGIGGQDSREISARQGGVPSRVTVTGGVIPASGSVEITLTQKLRSSATAWKGVISGVAGSFTPTNLTSYLVGTFTRDTAGIPVKVPSGTPFQTGYDYRAHWPIIWLGRNNFKLSTDAAQIASDLAGMLAWCTADAREHALVYSIPPWPGEYVGGPYANERARLDQANAAIRDVAPTAFVDTSAILRNLDVLTAVGITPTADDIAAVANDATPPSFQTADGHFNDKGYEALYIATDMIYAARGWK